MVMAKGGDMKTTFLWMCACFLAGLMSPLAGCGDDDGDSDQYWDLSEPYGDAVLLECHKRTVCESEFTLQGCLGLYLSGDDSYSFESILFKPHFLERRECVAAASNCTQLEECFQAEKNAFGDDAPTEPCSGYPEGRCEDDRLIWCLGGDGYEAEEPTPLIMDLRLMDKVCDRAGEYGADPGHIACSEEEYPEGEKCSDQIIESCPNGELLSFNCSHIHRDFVCYMRYGDQADCAMIPMDPGCEELSDEHSSWGRCSGNTAEVCVSGKLLRVDCSTFLDARCEGDDMVRCESDAVTEPNPNVETITIAGQIVDFGASPISEVEVCWFGHTEVPCVRTDDKGDFELYGDSELSGIPTELGALQTTAESYPQHLFWVPAEPPHSVQLVMNSDTLIDAAIAASGAAWSKSNGAVLVHALGFTGPPPVSGAYINFSSDSVPGPFFFDSTFAYNGDTQTTVGGPVLYFDAPPGSYTVGSDVGGAECDGPSQEYIGPAQIGVAQNALSVVEMQCARK
jgi:hypothetical protein